MASQLTRTLWGMQFDRCWCCQIHANDARLQGRPLETHEIRGGAVRARSVQMPAAWIRLCSECHDDLQCACDYAYMMALKKVHDPEHYDRVAVNSLLSPNRRGGWDNGPVTESEVDEKVGMVR